MKKSNQETADKITFKNLRRLYFFALWTIAVTIILSQVLVQYNLKQQLSDSKIINISGKQRMLSQKIVKEVLILHYVSDTTSQKQISHLKNVLSLWKNNQNSLENGNDSLAFPKEKSETLDKLYLEIKPSFNNIVKTTDLFLLNLEQKNNLATNQKLVETILKNEGLFLSKMNQIVSQYDLEAHEKVTEQRRIEYWIFAFTLFVLLLEFFFIFKPTNKKIERLIAKLLSSEKKALKLAYDTEIISEIKENSVKELKSLNYAMENTLLYCRIAPDGSIIHIGEKFAKLLNYTKFSSNKKFSEVLTTDEKEQLNIDRIIFEKQRSGWQGEINIINKEAQNIWLDLSMVPVTIKKDELELLIVCFNITERKKAQREVERLNIENSTEKINQQKVISSKIVENQENEQNRIAKEIHDGIGQMLTGLKFSLESINLDDKEKSAQKIEYLKKLSLDIIKGVRTATFNLMPPELSDHGIVSSLAKLTQELSKLTGKEILFYNKTDFSQRLDSLIEINIYRLTQEAINNAIKYAESSHIIVQLSHSNTLLSIIVDDNGKGFDVAAVDKKRNSESGMGMLFMQERIQYINGRVFFKSIPGEGTRITFNIPI
ncbi:type IV pili methyl-accepting chemotaxis transducer N-terminal domain-containing protein [Flavobacterium sp. LC2016-12]|uniref:PAS domain-containing sensor histidine kinase n=1 Tax=Flavobacterium sp. LC2016-12 TaxID=2783794 RepID=UPI00188D7A88|nr:type IV pili methyl-accepting chemotaxis transducer N-terminal domain-containing protein [Flavobacterium sp. LC2016-12]MBF4465231.1 type IV pili methyl-accepting chemotaxis transducer N-terminal domain-containing protein [Flavobacterium sp. LC2016-12]